MNRAGALLLALAALTPVAADAQGTGRRLALEDYLDIESVSDPKISPDGKQIVYQRGWIDRMAQAVGRDNADSHRAHPNADQERRDESGDADHEGMA